MTKVDSASDSEGIVVSQDDNGRAAQDAPSRVESNAKTQGCCLAVYKPKETKRYKNRMKRRTDSSVGRWWQARRSICSRNRAERQYSEVWLDLTHPSKCHPRS